MAVIRVQKTRDYTVMSNTHLRDMRLSLKAVGLLSKLLSLRDDWEYTVEGLTRICKEGKDAITTALKELETTGYLVREQTHDESGGFAGMAYTIYETPRLKEGESPSPLTDFPSTVNPSTGNPLTGNPPQSSTEGINYLDINPPHIPPLGDGAPKKKKREPKKKPDHLPERFNAFWTAYPRHENKQGAIAAWDKLHADEGLLYLMEVGLKRALQSEDWQRGIGIPYACRWLSNRRWEDYDDTPDSAPATEEVCEYL